MANTIDLKMAGYSIKSRIFRPANNGDVRQKKRNPYQCDPVLAQKVDPPTV